MSGVIRIFYEAKNGRQVNLMYQVTHEVAVHIAKMLRESGITEFRKIKKKDHSFKLEKGVVK